MTDKREKIILVGIIFISLILRAIGIFYDLPYIYHPDEPTYISISQNIFKTGDLNPHFFNYPSLFFYINALAYLPYFLINKIFGKFAVPADIPAPHTLVMGVTKISNIGPVVLGRSVTLLFGVLTVFVVYQIGKRYTSKASVRLLAALIIAVLPTNVAHSRFITPDTFITFFAAASVLAIYFVYREGKAWQYILAGLCIGFTTSSKYNGAIIVVPLILAHLFRYGKNAWREPKIYLSGFFMLLGFLLFTPYSLLDFATFYKGFHSEAVHYSTGHLGMEGNTTQWYLNYMFQTGGVIYIFALFELLRGLFTRSKETILLSVFPLTYFLFINSFIVRNDRTFLPITPPLAVLSASFIIFLLSWLKNMAQKVSKPVFYALSAALLLIVLMIPLQQTVKNIISLYKNDSRTEAILWVNNHVPHSTKIAIEAYSPFISQRDYSVIPTIQIVEHSPEWYAENGVEYLVFSKAMFGRFYENPELYKDYVDRYNQFFDHFTQVKAFQDDTTEILIYKMGK